MFLRLPWNRRSSDTVKLYVDGHHSTTVQVCVSVSLHINSDQTVCEALYIWSSDYRCFRCTICLPHIKTDQKLTQMAITSPLLRCTSCPCSKLTCAIKYACKAIASLDMQRICHIASANDTFDVVASSQHNQCMRSWLIVVDWYRSLCGYHFISVQAQLYLSLFEPCLEKGQSGCTLFAQDERPSQFGQHHQFCVFT